VAAEAGVNVAPVASAIADRWRDLVHNGSSGLDVSATRNGLEPAPDRPPGRWPTWIAADPVVSDNRLSVSI
jgi:hypothetical protein